MKSLLPRLMGNPITSRILSSLEQAQDRDGVAHLLRVLTYHRVDEPDAHPHLNPAVLSATPQNFEAQMGFIRHHYQPVSVYQVMDYFEKGSPLPPRAILVTFDDAYRDFAQHAWKVLKAYGIPVVMFVATAFPDHPERIPWWDQLYNAIHQTHQPEVSIPSGSLPLTTTNERRKSFKQLRNYIKSLPHETAMQKVGELCAEMGVAPLSDNSIMGWDQLRQLAKEGVTLGAHTRTHPLLNRVDLEQACQEATASLCDLQEQIGNVPPVFAYPAGGFTHSLAKELGGSGFKLAFTTVSGINRLATANPLLLRRINVSTQTSLNMLRMQLLSSAVHLNRFWHE